MLVLSRYNKIMKLPRTHIKQVVSLPIRGISYLYDKTHWFTDKEAWALFRLFAFGEAVGWTLLISAIIYRSFGLPGSEVAVSIAGRIHGVLFLLYFVFVLLTARSMMWGFWKTSIALIAGMPPYLSLVFEKSMAYIRKRCPVNVAPPPGSDS